MLSVTDELRIDVLSTDTRHHGQFVRELARRLPTLARIGFVLFETKAYPWERRARTQLAQTFPNLWSGIARNPYLQSASFNPRILGFERAHFFPEGDSAYYCPMLQ